MTTSPLVLFENALRERLHLQIRMKREEADGVRLLYADLTPLRLNFDPLTPFLLVPAGLVEGDATSIAGLLRDLLVRHRLTGQTCFAVVDAPIDARPLLSALGQQQLVVLGRESAGEIAHARSISESLLKEARRQLPRIVLSPYVTNRPVTGSSFYGREHEVRLVVTRPGSSYALLGMRRIGKTSLMQEIKRRIEEQAFEGEQSGGVVFIDCSTYSGIDLLHTIIDRVSPRKTRRFQETRFVEVMRELSGNGKRRIHVFLDEVDKLLEKDRAHSWELLYTLRSSANEGYARYVFAGQRRVIAQLTARDSPFFNFAHPIEIGVFARQVALELIRTPMAQLGVQIQDQLVERVVIESGGHPNILQFYCQFFLRKLDEQDRSDIRPEDLESVYLDTNFNTFVMGAFDINTTVLEKLIVYLLLLSKRSGNPAFNLTGLDADLQAQGLILHDAPLQEALLNLRNSGILEQTGGTYQFNIPILARLLIERYDLKYLVNRLKIEHSDALINAQ
jgi:hypothetical protein